MDPREALAELSRMLSEDKLSGYAPYPWQAEFHASHKKERMLIAANRVGKTLSAGAETAMHLTGKYPDWWQGKRFDKAVLAWTGSPTNETSRDIVQRELLGGLGDDLGTGWVPKALIKGKPMMRQAGVSNVVDTFQVRHASGRLSTCVLKTYEQGWRKWQGTAPDVVWLDEEPEDYKIYTEALTRLLTSQGTMLVTFTPLLGVTTLVDHFLNPPPGASTFVKTATWNDAPHLREEDKAALRASYPAWELEARTLGVPMMGEGRVFTTPEEEVKIDPFTFPPYYAHICGIDFGIDHNQAAAWLAYDADTDTVYLYACYRKANEFSAYHAEAIKSRGPWIPVAWPHDGVNREKGGTGTLANSYIKLGVNMLGKSARYPRRPGEKEEKSGAQPTEPIVMEMNDRLRSGRFRVFSNCSEFFDEYRSYHRKDGRLVDKRDDLLKAVFYGLMMIRYAARQQPKMMHRTHAAVVRARV